MQEDIGHKILFDKLNAEESIKILFDKWNVESDARKEMRDILEFYGKPLVNSYIDDVIYDKTKIKPFTIVDCFNLLSLIEKNLLFRANTIDEMEDFIHIVFKTKITDEILSMDPLDILDKLEQKGIILTFYYSDKHEPPIYILKTNNTFWTKSYEVRKKNLLLYRVQKAKLIIDNSIPIHDTDYL